MSKRLFGLVGVGLALFGPIATARAQGPGAGGGPDEPPGGDPTDEAASPAEDPTDEADDTPGADGPDEGDDEAVPQPPAEPPLPPDEDPGFGVEANAGLEAELDGDDAAAEVDGAEGDAADGDAGDADEEVEEDDEAVSGRFSFGSYGRVITATDGRGGPGRDADIVAHGSRLDESNYVELELRRDDEWAKTGMATRVVSTLAIANPVFHYDGEFDVALAVRNLYLQVDRIGVEGLRGWAGSRMLRGDDIYLLDFWPLDNLNTLGAGVGYNHERVLDAELHAGFSMPNTPFYQQSVVRPAPLDRFGTSNVDILARQRFIGSARIQGLMPLGDEGAGLKAVGYGELHQLGSGQREEDAGGFEDLPSDSGYVLGVQLGGFLGERATHVNLFLRYAQGLAAYGQFASPGQLATDETTSGAHEVLAALGANYEIGPFGIMLGGYLRSFRDASEPLNYEDVDEGIVVARPHVFFGEIAGIALEGSYQAAQRGLIAPVLGEDGEEDLSVAPEGPISASVVRFGVVPFISPAGAGDYSRPHLRFIYTLAARDENAKRLYPSDDIFARRDVEHFIGVGAEWWFNSSSYGQ